MYLDAEETADASEGRDAGTGGGGAVGRELANVDGETPMWLAPHDRDDPGGHAGWGSA
jgi:hypothetical protein